MGLLQAARALQDGSLRCETLVRDCLARIAERNQAVRAFVAIDEAGALSQARAVDAGARAGLLRGLPMGVKDVIETADLPTAYGSPIYAGHRPRADAGCVARARAEGAIVLGKLATSEFATQSPSDTRNPLDLARTPGGSSSGSAAAVADGMVPIAFGTQTTGSIVRPASYCGVVGYKPTYGFFADAGLKALSPAQDTIGLLARSVQDAAFFAFGVHGSQVGDTDAGLRPRLAVCMSSQWQHARPETVACIEAAAAAAERAGAQVQSLVLPQLLEDMVPLQSRLFAYEARQTLAHEAVHHADRFTPRLRQRLEGGVDITLHDYLAMRRRAVDARAALHALMAQSGIDALLYPAADGEAELGIADSGSPRYGALWSLMHVPCVSLPTGRGPHGLPIGLQVIGRYAEDAHTLAVAAFMERAIDFSGSSGRSATR